jgi:hypothetical protein
MYWYGLTGTRALLSRASTEPRGFARNTTPVQRTLVPDKVASWPLARRIHGCVAQTRYAEAVAGRAG